MAGPASICSANESYSQSDLRPGDRAGTITQCGPDPTNAVMATAAEHGRMRHGARYRRLRADLYPTDLATGS
ncbi:hypothetical protein PSA01_40590 [Pseudonocardia saturnea]|uniref:Uncharacterized protein n=1 Tax=Pseudonocardia saturnea TaxID=33909 RepID=A0ABQ0S2A0_9PSEU|nr:hypothetical protein Pdca_69850 [Pseudonocardia autotrophica]GEC27030.1 hypothetical protein PSA01_40590 [Pseudonocardia saturnea]